VDISTALRVPDDDRGVEVTLQFQPQKIGTKLDHTLWIEFRVSSYIQDNDEWQTHCRGLIQTIYKSSLTPEMERKSFLLARDSCNGSEDSLYETLDSLGVQYGKMFQNVREVYAGYRQGRGVIRIPDTKSYMPQNFEYPCVVHPATLDSVFQLVFPSIFDPDKPLTAAVVPVSINRLYVSADIGTTPGLALDGFSNSKKTGPGTWEASIFVSANEWTSPTIIVEGMDISSLGGRRIQEFKGREMCSEMIWQEDATFLSNDEIKDFILERTLPDEDDDTLPDRLDHVCLIYIQRILEWFKSDGLKVPLPGFFNLYYKWMNDKPSLSKTSSCDSRQLENALREAKDAIRGSRAGTLTLALIDCIGENLEKIFTREVEPLQLFLEGDLLYTF
jgi:hypothetical protein